jgi:tetratricopeptide (TPR) repeat protein
MKHIFNCIICLLLAGSSTAVLGQKTSISEVMQKEMMNAGTDAAIKRYEVLKKNEPDKYDFSEGQLRELGLGLLQMGRQMDAKKILKLNMQSFPQSSEANYYLGFILYRLNDNPEALTYLKKSRSLSKTNFSARDLIQAIEHPDEYSKYEYVCEPCGCSQHNLKFKEGGVCIHCGMTLVKGGK